MYKKRNLDLPGRGKYKIEKRSSHFSATGLRMVIRLAAFLLELIGAAGAAVLKTLEAAPTLFRLRSSDFSLSTSSSSQVIRSF